MLKIKNINVYYGNIHVLRNISLTVTEGKIIAIIGANGAGKTTTLKTISGILTPRNGEILFQRKSILKNPQHEIVKMGIAHVPEGRQIFQTLTVEENLDLGGYINTKEKNKSNMTYVYTLFPRLYDRKKQIAGTLSGGEQQMLAISRALMLEPMLIMLDEPSLGLSPILVELVFSIIQKLRDNGSTVLLVEQNAHLALNISDYAYVFDTGQIVDEGLAKELLIKDSIKSAYLGGM